MDEKQNENDMMIVPYIYHKDGWTLPYNTIVDIWDKMVSEGTDRIVFQSGVINSFESFMNFLQNKKNHVVTIWDDECAIVFISWINGFAKTSANIHFNAFKKIWGKKTVEIMLMAFKYWFELKDDEDEYLFDTIMGMIPDDNQRAIEMVKRCGVHVVGVIPNYNVNVYTKKKIGATVLYIEREEVLNG